MAVLPKPALLSGFRRSDILVGKALGNSAPGPLRRYSADGVPVARSAPREATCSHAIGPRSAQRSRLERGYTEVAPRRVIPGKGGVSRNCPLPSDSPNVRALGAPAFRHCDSGLKEGGSRSHVVRCERPAGEGRNHDSAVVGARARPNRARPGRFEPATLAVRQAPTGAEGARVAGTLWSSSNWVNTGRWFAGHGARE